MKRLSVLRFPDAADRGAACRFSSAAAVAGNARPGVRVLLSAEFIPLGSFQLFGRSPPPQ